MEHSPFPVLQFVPAPFTTVTSVGVNENGDIIVTEVVREGAGKLEAYVDEVANALINVVSKVRSVYSLEFRSVYSTLV